MESKKLFDTRLVVVNVGLKSFGEGVREQGVKVAQVAWRPTLSKELRVLLDKVL
jgi:hypothetical protein